MTDVIENEEVLFAQREVRHLKDTITALREQMEVLQAEQVQAVQTAHTTADAEMRQLRDTAVALRDQLEASEERGRNEVYSAERTARDEIEQYRETIRELRDRLEAAGITHGEAKDA